MEGILAKWNDQRRFGFIAPVTGDPEVFVHISAFPLDGIRPVQGERLGFEIITGEDGAKRARILHRPDRQTHHLATTRHAERRNRGFFRLFMLLVVFGLLAYAAHAYYTRHASAPLSLVEGIPADNSAAPGRPESARRTDTPPHSANATADLAAR